MADQLYTFTFEVKRVQTQEFTVRGTDRDSALAFATTMIQAEQRGEPDCTLELVNETSKPITHAPKPTRPVGNGGT